MNIPQNITKNHLLSAISKIDKEGIPNNGDSQYYDVLFNEKKYPPKLIVSYANIYANGSELDRNSFPGGQDTPSFKLLEEHGFIIVEKNKNGNMSYFGELNKFLAQAKTGSLKHADYLKEYLGLKVKVSFGQTNLAKVPWISFLADGQSTSNGIYPVYLLYKDIHQLVLAYGVSEKNKPILKWQIKEPSLLNFFKSNSLGSPKPYPNSFMFRIYDINLGLEKDTINNDLSELIEIYKQTLQNISDQDRPKDAPMNFDYNSFIESTVGSNLFLNEKLCLRFTASLLTKSFLILTGLSGSGKTMLAHAFARWICENENQYCIVAVGADWTNREPLLGFPNALKEKDYIIPDNRVLDLIIKANNDPDKPYFLILDEMNLSHVERYFADFLSAMESRSTISLHPGNEAWNGIPPEIDFPKNLFIVGTVNIDETTYMFSPKVLDRANVIEFSVTGTEMKTYLQSNKDLNLSNLKGMGSHMAVSFVEMAKQNHEINKTEDRNNLYIALSDFFTELKKTGAEFGFRTATEIIRFVAVVNKLDLTWTINDIIDIAIMQKLLPKVHGSKRRLEPVLKTLGSLCLESHQKFDDILSTKSEIDLNDSSKIKYPVSLEKILRMYDNLINNSFTSYAEA